MNKDKPDYQPIACTTHSQYELWIMHRQPLQLDWHDETEEQHSAHVLPVDLITRNRQEFLRVQLPDGQPCEIRLDYISGCTPLA